MTIFGCTYTFVYNKLASTNINQFRLITQTSNFIVECACILIKVGIEFNGVDRCNNIVWDIWGHASGRNMRNNFDVDSDGGGSIKPGWGLKLGRMIWVGLGLEDTMNGGGGGG